MESLSSLASAGQSKYHLVQPIEESEELFSGIIYIT